MSTYLKFASVLFVVVNGVPSIGVQVMIGSGQLGTQKILDVAPLPPSGTAPAPNSATTSGSNNQADANSAISLLHPSDSFLLLVLTLATWTLGASILAL